jgi:hypothetical protein
LAVGVTGALASVAVVKALMMISDPETEWSVLVSLGSALLAVVFVLAGRHSAEMRVRQRRALELLDDVSLKISVNQPEEHLKYGELISLMERESQFSSGTWWWFPNPRLFDHILLDLFRSQHSPYLDLRERFGVERLRMSLGRIDSAKVADLCLDLREQSLNLYPKRPREEQMSPQIPRFEVGDEIVHSRFGEGYVTQVLGENAHVRFQKVDG